MEFASKFAYVPEHEEFEEIAGDIVPAPPAAPAPNLIVSPPSGIAPVAASPSPAPYGAPPPVLPAPLLDSAPNPYAEVPSASPVGHRVAFAPDPVSAPPAPLRSAPVSPFSPPAGSFPFSSFPSPAPLHPFIPKRKTSRFGEDAETPMQPAPKKVVRKADTNVVALSLNTLASDAKLLTGDPVVCSSCKGILSAISTFKEVEGGAQLWKCEFCDTENTVRLSPEEVPKVETLDYLVEPAPAAKAVDDNAIIFCIDISGSMCVTTEVSGNLKLRGAEERHKAMAALNPEGFGQHLPSHKKNITYVSRLQCVQAAVDMQLEALSKEFPNRRVAVVTFNNEVTVVGDGTGVPVTVTGERLENMEECLRVGESHVNIQPVKQTSKALSKKVYSLEEGGGTALGPALVVAIGMASHRPGGTVVICTDGLANIGLGAMDTAAKAEAAENFYASVSKYAQEKGVVVNVFSIKGTDCKMEFVGKLADVTNGAVDICDPLNIAQQFGNILTNAVIATNCSLTFLLHKGMEFRNQEQADGNKLTREVGNVTIETEVSFEYGIKPESKALEVKELPFQVQIHYTKLDKSKCVRVITKSQPVTRDREKAEKEADLNLLSVNAAQTGARMASRGYYDSALTYNAGYDNLVNRTSHLSPQSAVAQKTWSSHRSHFDSAVRSEIVSEHARGRTYNDGYITLPSAAQAAGYTPVTHEDRERDRDRSYNRSDESANVLYQAKKMTRNKFSSLSSPSNASPSNASSSNASPAPSYSPVPSAPSLVKPPPPVNPNPTPMEIDKPKLEKEEKESK